MRSDAPAVKSEATKEAFNATDHGPARAASRASGGRARSPWQRDAPDARRGLRGRADAQRHIADVAHAADPRHLARRPPAADPFELRDPEYIARTLPALRVMADVWFRADVRGLESFLRS